MIDERFDFRQRASIQHPLSLSLFSAAAGTLLTPRASARAADSRKRTAARYRAP